MIIFKIQSGLFSFAKRATLALRIILSDNCRHPLLSLERASEHQVRPSDVERLESVQELIQFTSRSSSQ